MNASAPAVTPWVIHMNDPDAVMDPEDPLQFPPMDNSTGVWQEYTPPVAADETANSSVANEFVPADCAFAAAHGAPIYWQSCQSQWSKGSAILRYRITVSGTGYVLNTLFCKR